jgi:hypothetical protein
LLGQSETVGPLGQIDIEGDQVGPELLQVLADANPVGAGPDLVANHAERRREGFSQG